MLIAITLSGLILSIWRCAQANPNQEAIVQLQRQAVIAAQGGNYDAAVKLCTKELNLLLSEKREAAAGRVYIDLAQIDHIRGLFTAAELKYKKGVNLLKRYGDPNDPRLVGALDGLGWLYVTWGRSVDGMRIMDQSRARAEDAHLTAEQRIKHLDTQAAYLAVQARYSDAQQNWNRALEIGKRNFALDPSQYDYVLLHFGQASAVYGDYATATQLFREFLQADRNPSGAAAISHAVAEGELAHVYVKMHKLSEARPWFEQSLALFNSSTPQAPLIYSMVLSYFGDYYMAAKDWKAAELRYRDALRIRQNVVGNSHAAAASMLALSRALTKLHLKREAKDLLARAKVILVAEGRPLQNETVDVLALQHE